MKSLRIVSFVLMALGVLLFSTGLLFKIQHWPDMFRGYVSGPVLIISGVLIFVIILVLRKK